MNKVILYIATSQDGFIADANGNVDWLPQPQTEADLEVVGYNDLMNRIDTIVMGSVSFKQICGFGDWAWKDKQTYVFSFELIKNIPPYIILTNQSPRDFVQAMALRESGKDIWLLGGAQLAQSFFSENLIDEIILTVVPQKINTGISLGISFEQFTLEKEKNLMNGIVQKFYARNA